MFYYRFRPSSEIFIKELIYNEMFFCSTQESNDPFDSKSFYVFSKDKDRWERLLKFLWKDTTVIDYINIESTAANLVSKSPLSFSELLSEEFRFWLFNCIETIIRHRLEIIKIKEAALKIFLERIILYYPHEVYFVSFSRINDEPLMWSHYAEKHQGFCLIYKAIDNKLIQFKSNIKKSICRKTTSGLAPHMQYGIPEAFLFENIQYTDNTDSLDAFLHFPEYVYGNSISEDDRLKIAKQQYGQFLQKHVCWQYEKESRIVLNSAIPWLFGEQVSLSKQERLLYYEPTQLVGIIFGARMHYKLKQTISEIIDERMDKIARGVDYPRTIFDFVIFESKLSHDSRNLQISPIMIKGLSGKTINHTEKNFQEQYNKWEKGEGLNFNNGSCKKITIE